MMALNGVMPCNQPNIVALTGHAESDFFTQAFKKGINQVYSKPVKSSQIKLILLENKFRLDPSHAKLD